MKYMLCTCLMAVALLQPAGLHAAEEPRGSDNLAYRWAGLALQVTASDTDRFRPRPTVTSRYLALVFTAVFDAWSRYDGQATPVYLTGVPRRPAAEATRAAREEAISYAAYGTLREYFYSDSIRIRNFMLSLGYDPDNQSLDPATPAGIGNLAARAVIEARRSDGSNQYGDAPGGNGTPYFNYTGYEPVNPPDVNVDGNRWQPKYFADGQGGRFAPACLTPFWQLVQPIALDSASQFRPGPPPLLGSEQLEREVQQVVDVQAALTDEDKALVELMRDGPASVQQAGHWLIFAMQVSERDRHTLDQDVRLYFLNQVAAMDAFIACWDAKMHYDFARPYALVHHYFADQEIRGWGGSGGDMVSLKGQDWRPYSPETFLCPPFPSYTSGHSTVSGACAEVLRLFTGNDAFEHEITRVAGALTHPENPGDTVVLRFRTFTETADRAGWSRVLGGYHIQTDNVAGLELGRQVARRVWEFYQSHVSGSSE